MRSVTAEDLSGFDRGHSSTRSCAAAGISGSGNLQKPHRPLYGSLDRPGHRPTTSSTTYQREIVLDELYGPDFLLGSVEYNEMGRQWRTLQAKNTLGDLRLASKQQVDTRGG